MADLNATTVRIPAATLAEGAVVELSQDAEGVIGVEIRMPVPPTMA